MKTIATKIAFSLSLMLMAPSLHARGVGISALPLPVGQKLISTEFTGILSKGGGIGFQGRFSRKIRPLTTLDLGVGMSGGDHSSQAFVGVDTEVLPEYRNQPRVSVKGYLESAKEAGTRQNRLAMAPTLSKGFSFWGHVAYPHISFPYSIDLDANNKTYATSLSTNLGVSGILPIRGQSSKPLIGHAEAVIGLKNGHTGLMVGVSWMMD